MIVSIYKIWFAGANLFFKTIITEKQHFIRPQLQMDCIPLYHFEYPSLPAVLYNQDLCCIRSK